MSSSEATAPHNGTKTLSITIKRVCVCGLAKQGDRESEEGGGGVTMSRMFRGVPKPKVGHGRLLAGSGQKTLVSKGWDVLHLGKQELGAWK